MPSSRPERSSTAGASRREMIHRVSARPERTRDLRRRRARGRIAIVFLVVVALGGLAWGAWHLRERLIIQNPAYQVRAIEARSDGPLPREALVRAAGLREGENIFQADLGAAAARLLAMPQVEDAKVSRRLPDTLVIEVRERRPVAWVAPAGASAPREALVTSPDALLADRNGFLLRSRRTAAELAHLPLIRGVPAAELRPGQPLQSEEARSALEFLAQFAAAPVAARFSLQEVDVSRGWRLVATDKRGLQATFSLPGSGLEKTPLEEQFRRLDLLAQEWEKSGQRPATANLLLARGVPVTFQPDAPLPSPGASAPPAAASPADASPSSASAPPAARARREENDDAPPAAASRREESARRAAAPSPRPVRRALPPPAAPPVTVRKAERVRPAAGPEVRKALPVGR